MDFLLPKPTDGGTRLDLCQGGDNFIAIVFGVGESQHVIAALFGDEELYQGTCVDEVKNLEPPSVAQENLRGRCALSSHLDGVETGRDLLSVLRLSIQLNRRSWVLRCFWIGN